MENTQENKVLLRVTDVKQWFPVKKTRLFQKEQLYVKANDGISLDIYEGETVGLVGESGCGKSTFGRVLLQLYHQTEGKTMYYGRSLVEMAPLYVDRTLKNIDTLKKSLKEWKVKKEQTEETFLNLPDGIEKFREQELFEQAAKGYQKAFLDITQLIGGFLVAGDLTEVVRLYLEKFKTARELRDLRLQNKAVYEVKTEVTEQIRELEEKLSWQEEKIEKLRVDFKGNKRFVEYETYRDEGVDLARLTANEMRILRKDMQLIFQDPYSSLNPRMTVGQIIGEGLLAHQFFQKNDDKMQEYIMEVMEDCGLAPYMIHRYPHQFSGGQRQRIGIARALALKPRFVVCDEAVSALDVSIQSQIVNLLKDLGKKDNLAYLFISHGLSVVKYISDRIGVMYLGNLVELATSKTLFEHPMHPYTEALLASIPTTDAENKKELVALEGDIPSPIKPPEGCKFHTRCRYCTEICRHVQPEFREMEPKHYVVCHHVLDKSAKQEI